VVVGGISVGRITPGLVGGSVEVTKRTGASVGAVPGETLTHEVRRKMRKKVQYAFLFMVPGV
jgi:hypothetical protein